MSAIEGCQFFICRLYGIDALETPSRINEGNFRGREAQTQKKHPYIRRLPIDIRDRDKYGRKVCVIRKKSKDMNLETIERPT